MIASGMNKLYARGDAWPPSAIEFAELCRPEIKDPIHKIYPIGIPKLVDREKGKQRCSELLKLISDNGAA